MSIINFNPTPEQLAQYVNFGIIGGVVIFETAYLITNPNPQTIVLLAGLMLIAAIKGIKLEDLINKKE
jgi:hypothetical protein